MNQEDWEIGRKPLKERTRLPSDALTHSVNHWIRVEAIAIFHDGEFSAGEVAEMIGEDVKLVSGHIRDLYDSGSIERAGYKMVGNHRKPVYRAVIRAVVSDEAYRAMSIEDRHDLNGAVVQGLHAETVSSYRNGKMDSDENLCLVWQALNLDAEGKWELMAHLTAAWEAAKEIEARAANRMAESGESGTSSVVGLLGFERGRAGRPVSGYRKSEKKIAVTRSGLLLLYRIEIVQYSKSNCRPCRCTSEEVVVGDAAESKASDEGAQPKRTKSAGADEPCETDDLIRAINHALRRQILRYLHSSRKPLSPKQLERKLGLSDVRSGVLSSVSYHVGVLRDFKAITMVKTEPRRGAVEHFYESAVSGSAWIRNLLKRTQKRDEALIWDGKQVPRTKRTQKKESKNSG